MFCVYMASRISSVSKICSLSDCFSPLLCHLLCPSYCLLSVFLQEVFNSVYLSLSCHPVFSRSSLESITAWLEMTECLLIALRKICRLLIASARIRMIWSLLWCQGLLTSNLFGVSYHPALPLIPQSSHMHSCFGAFAPAVHSAVVIMEHTLFLF